jgi:cyclic pyranopterin phosphate synthase
MHIVKVNNLRVSITQRCNMSCMYCHREGERRIAEREINRDEFERILRIASDCGIEKLKITGGEPLMRKDVTSLVGTAKDYMKDISMTTNGSLLPIYAEKLSEAGLNRVNVSLDSLRRERFRAITSGSLDKVIGGIKSARDAGMQPIKINTVVLKGVNDDEVWDLADFSRAKGCVLQLKELEATKEGENEEFYAKYHCDLRALEEELSARAERIEMRSMHHRKKYLVDGAEIEVVRPMHNTEFCANCTRLRVTSEGMLKPCLLREDEVSLPEDEDAARRAFLEAIESKRPYWG